MYAIHLFMRPLKKPVYERIIGGFPYVRCYTDINYRVFVKSDARSEKYEVLLAPWGRHAGVNGTNLLDHWSVRTDAGSTIAASFDEDRVCLAPWGGGSNRSS